MIRGRPFEQPLLLAGFHFSQPALQLVHSFGQGHDSSLEDNTALLKDICPTCLNALWVCEDHLDLPWGGASDSPFACHCGGAGAPCPRCNVGDPPRMPDGHLSFVRENGPVN